MIKSTRAVSLLSLCFFSFTCGFAQSPQKQAQAILEATGVRGGLVVHLGCGDGKLTIALRANQSYMVHGLDADAAHVQAARKNIQATGLYGTVSADRVNGRLPYTDNMVNLIVAEKAGSISNQEMLRVLVPGGVVYTKKGNNWLKTTKPVPSTIDEWTHFLHDASSNAVAHDDVVGPPRHLQWIGSPRWSRHHDRMASMSALVSTGGRIFYIQDEGSRVSIQLPPKWSLIARDAFNGTVLWKRPIAKWFSHLWPLKSGPTQLARRLVAVKDKVFVTLSLGDPVTVLDAATGETIHSYKESKGTEEIIVSDGVAFLLVNKGQWALADYNPKLNVGDQGRVGKEYRWNEKPRELMAFDTDTGKRLWVKESKVAPLTISADAERLFYYDGEKVFALNRKTGEEVWTSGPAKRRQFIPFNFGPRIVIYKDTVLFAGGDRTMKAFNAADGKELWTAPHARGGYSSPEDLLVAGGIVWSAPTTSSRDSGVYTGRDPRTGEVKAEFPPNVSTYWFHHRCHMGKATDKYLLPSRTGIEFVDYRKKDWNINHWVRGGCLYGILPCNGLIYAPPHNCACYPEAKLYGFNALAPTASRQIKVSAPDGNRLEKGAAFGQVTAGSGTNGDWPTLRRDASRSGSTEVAIPTDLKESWQADIGGRLSSIVSADGKVFVSQIDQHTVHALDAKTGNKVWAFTAGGRVDSPPTIYRGTAVFGSADGSIYCVRASDGELVWRFRAAPADLRVMAFEQLESVWPVSGSVLIQKDVLYAIAGRSLYLDGGLRFIKLNPTSGELISEKVIDHVDPETGKNLQARLKTLQMPVGLPDVLSSDGKFVYMRSQRFDLEGKRITLGPFSGNALEQGRVQAGEGAHIFSSTGYLDDSYFHRSYWVYGKTIAGGHNGYYQAAKWAPAGRLLVADDSKVYGFGRKPQYLRWTTIIEHQLFAADKKVAEGSLKEEEALKLVPAPKARRRGKAAGGASMVHFGNTKKNDPTKTPLAAEAWLKATTPTGVIVARGGPAQGYALHLEKGRPVFSIRSANEVYSVTAKQKTTGRWVHLAGVLSADKELELFIDGKSAGKAKGAFITSQPIQTLQIGGDDAGEVGKYRSPNLFTGMIEEARVYFGEVSPEEIAKHAATTKDTAAAKARLILHCNFAEGKAKNLAEEKEEGDVKDATAAEGQRGAALAFKPKPSMRANRSGGSTIQRDWTQDIPLLVQAMLLSGKTLFIAGPPDIINEEETFSKLVNKDEKIHEALSRQDAALNGKDGAHLWAVSTADGSKLAEYKLDALPVWDGMAAVEGQLFISTRKGNVVCYGAK